MVLISDKKYACETCIKGHRSSGCKHTDRPLFLIQKKGRPVTQCEHCRELRKTRQVHVKCICEAKEPPPSASLKPKKKGTPVIPPHAAFPNGLPPELASDSDQGGSAPSASGCTCKAGTGECHCCTPRERPVQRRSSAPTTSKSNPSPTQPASPTSDSNGPSPNTQSRAPSHHILARIAELRPVLPRMSARDAALQAQAGGQHDLFHGNHPSSSGHHHVDHFSPYGRAYDIALHGSEGGFYQQDGRSVESLMSVNSLSSHRSGRSHGKGSQPGQKSPIEDKGHGQRSASFDGQAGTFSGFFGTARPPESEWRLPPSLSRSSVEPAPYPRSEPSFSLAESGCCSDGAYPRSEGGDGVGHPRARSEESYPVDVANMRMCGCGEACGCPGCAVHNPQSANSSPIPGQKGCTDTACGDSCLDCTLLGISGYPSFDGPGPSNLKQEDDLASPLDPNAAAFPERPQLRLGGYDDQGVPEPFDFDKIELDFEGYDPNVPYGPVNAFEQIDEWIQALPPPPPSGTLPSPFDFGDGEMSAFDLSEVTAPPTWGAVQMFDLEVDQAEGAPAGLGVLAARSTTSTSSGSERRFSGLSGGSPDPNLLYSHSRGSSGAFLTVPGPDAHRRSRSSSSASSDVSSGLFGGIGAMSLDHVPPPPPSPLKQHGAPGTMEMSMLTMQHPALTILPPPPSGIAVNTFMDDDQMSFY